VGAWRRRGDLRGFFRLDLGFAWRLGRHVCRHYHHHDMYLGLTYSIAEMSPALPHTGGAYSFARTASGRGWLHNRRCREHRYVLTPAVIVYSSHLSHGDFETPPLPAVWWIFG